MYVECIPTVFGLSFEDMVDVQQNTMKREGKSNDNDKTHTKKELFLNNYDVAGESCKGLESLR